MGDGNLSQTAVEPQTATELAEQPFETRSGFGDTVRRLRKERGLTQGQLAAHVGVSQTAVSAWECGIREVATDNFLKLAEVLDFDISELAANARKALGDAEEVRLLAAFRALPKERRLTAIKLVEALTLSNSPGDTG